MAEGVWDAAAIIVGAFAAVWFLASAVRTMVIPRPERVWLTAIAFSTARRITHALAGRITAPDRRHHVLGTFAPVVLISLPVIWSLGLIAAFAAIYWGLDVGSVTDAIELSGSSLTTLGFTQAPTFTTRMVAVVEALFGLALIAFVIGFLPTLYGTFSRREIAVGRLTTRAGEPPRPGVFLLRLHAIGRLDRIGERWDEWEQWFVELGETHTSFPALIHFRSARPGRSWLAAAETALDTAAVVTATRIIPSTGQGEILIRSGFLALRAVADFYRVEPETDPTDRSQLAVSREQFDSLVDLLAAGGLHSEVDRDQAWSDFAGWRVNYDRAIEGLKVLVGDVPTHWDHPRPAGSLDPRLGTDR